MLARLLNLLAEREHGLSLMEISRLLEAQPSAVEAMLHTLVRRGRLVEIGPDGGVCSECGEQVQCGLLAARGSRYALAAHPGKKSPGEVS
jgi:hypothetical protein